MNTAPIVTSKRSISAVWLLPFIALCICGWLVYTSYKNAGVEITITFDDASGIIPEKTQVVARGIPIGLVKRIVPDLGKQQIKAVVKIEQEVAEYLVEDTLFWIVRPELSASSVQGLDTILSGSYIGLRAGISMIPRREFAGLPSVPPVSPETPGLHIQLRADNLGSIQVGTGIYYRNIQIGSVQNHQLERDESIIIDLFIEPQFANLVRQGSRFCNTSGVQIGGKLPNLKIRIESLASLLRGGILLHTPEQLQDGPKAKNGHVFSLYPDYESANFGIPMTLTLASSEDIVEGSTKIMYRGLEAGFVKEIRINDDERKTVTAHILLDPRAELILRESTTFWLVKPEISPSGVNNLRLLLSGAHITFQPGDGAFQDHFQILPEAPPQIPLRAGKRFLLTSENPSSTSPNSPVYYKNIQVGKVVDIRIEPSGKKLETSIFIYQEYLHLVSKKSVFWEHSGFEVDASLNNGFSFTTGPLAKMLHGGVSFTTPDTLQKKKNFSPDEDHVFTLFNNYKEAVAAVPILQQRGVNITISSADGESLVVGAPLLHKNIKIGEVVGFQLPPGSEEVLIDCFIFQEFKYLVRQDSRFYSIGGVNFSGGLDGFNLQMSSLHSILAGGIGCFNPSQSPSLPSELPYKLYASRQQALHADDIELTFHFSSIQGIKEGSPVKHRGLTIGRIASLTLQPDLHDITGLITIDKQTAPLFRVNTKVWVEKAQIDLSGVKNAETIVFGAFLNILPGDGPTSRTFMVLEEPPLTEIANSTGLGIVLESRHLGSLSVSSPVYYRQVQVGRVTGWKLSPTFQKVHIFVAIDGPYQNIIRNNTRFWNVSGTRIEGGVFAGMTIATESFEAFLRGGIALATPNNEQTGRAVTSGHHFTLFDEAQKEWLDWNPDVVLLQLEQSQELLRRDEKR